MAHTDNERREFEWLEYYEQYDYFNSDAVRDHCHPRVLLHDIPSEKAIVLVHGLSDSPYFMSAIARHFHNVLGFDCYLPLLHFHGLTKPHGMEGVKLDEWKANVRFAIKTASQARELYNRDINQGVNADATPLDNDDVKVSIGGLSTGGALSFYMANHSPRIDGDLYLFSAALDLAGGVFGIRGEIKEWLGRSFLVDLFDKDKSLIGSNPYRYERVDLDGARELAHLIRETDDLLDDFDPARSRAFPYRVFAAHSASDSTAHINGIRALEKCCHQDDFHAHFLPEEAGVSHASLVLEEPVYAIDDTSRSNPLEAANPYFGEMLQAISAFATRQGN